MFCDGVCKNKKGKRCGLYATLMSTDKQTGKTTPTDKCIYFAQFKTLLNIEAGIDRLHAALNSQRNEEVNTGKEMSQVLANVGLLVHHAVNGNPETLARVKDLKQISEESNGGTETD